MRSSPKVQSGSTSHWWVTRTAARPRCSTLFRAVTNTSATTAASRWTPNGDTAPTEAIRFEITDLPGTYALTAYSPEELYVRRHLAEHTPDVIINAVVASNLERNLYLTTELIDLNPRVVVALNMYDELEATAPNSTTTVWDECWVCRWCRSSPVMDGVSKPCWTR